VLISVQTELTVQELEYMILYRWCYITGRQTAHDIAAFARESSQNAVRVLGPSDFPGVTNSRHPWFIDFYAPVSEFDYLLVVMCCDCYQVNVSMMPSCC